MIWIPLLALEVYGRGEAESVATGQSKENCASVSVARYTLGVW